MSQLDKLLKKNPTLSLNGFGKVCWPRSSAVSAVFGGPRGADEPPPLVTSRGTFPCHRRSTVLSPAVTWWRMWRWFAPTSTVTNTFAPRGLPLQTSPSTRCGGGGGCVVGHCRVRPVTPPASLQPDIVQHSKLPNKLFCLVTRVTLNKVRGHPAARAGRRVCVPTCTCLPQDPVEVEKHIKGKRFTSLKRLRASAGADGADGAESDAVRDCFCVVVSACLTFCFCVVVCASWQ